MKKERYENLEIFSGTIKVKLFHDSFRIRHFYTTTFIFLQSTYIASYSPYNIHFLPGHNITQFTKMRASIQLCYLLGYAAVIAADVRPSPHTKHIILIHARALTSAH